jgi:sugar lactone lactonase YvrE
MTTTPRLVLDGLGFPESTRWHDGRVWLCNWGAGEVLAASSGECEVMARVAPRTIPFSIDWLPDGRLLVIDGPRGLLLRQEPDGALSTVADLTGFGSPPFNELVVDATGNAYVNGGRGLVVCVAPDGTSRKVADGVSWPNGMALINDGRTLVVADSHAQQLVGFDVQDDSTLAGRRVWADLEQAPDGICADADGAIWVATVPGKSCVRVREGRRDPERGLYRSRLLCLHARRRTWADAIHRCCTVARHGGGYERRPGRTGQLLAVPNQPAPHAGRP